MTPGEKPYIFYIGRKYRDIEHRLENTYEEEEPVVDTEHEEPVIDTEQE